MALSYVTFVVLLLSTVCSGYISSFKVPFKQGIYIVPKEQDVVTTSFGVVNGLRSCGGSGKALEWRYEKCSGPGPCQVPADDTIRLSSLDFIPNVTSPSLSLKINFVDNSTHVGETVYEDVVKDSAVVQGQTYTIVSGGAAGEDLKGEIITVQIVLAPVGKSDMVQICAEADFEIV